MAVVQCPNGHSYDNSRHARCPYCTGSQTIGITVPLDVPGPGSMSGSAGVSGAGVGVSFPKTMPIQQTMPMASATDVGVTEPYQNVTKALEINNEGVSAVVGWLVCIKGKKKGKDFRIHGQRNFLGRASSNDICIDFDDSVSSVDNVIISYNEKNNKFYVQIGEHQKNNVYLNDEMLLAPMELKENDVLEMGDTKLMFRPFCNDSFRWE